MFAGITAVVASKDANDSDVLDGMRSREGEEVKFHKSINISEDSTIYKWLGRTEDTMQNSLAHLLSSSVQELETLDRSSQQTEFNEWICKYAAQLVLLALQVSWSRRIEIALGESSNKDKALKSAEL
jgi:dynein heavy chain 1